MGKVAIQYSSSVLLAGVALKEIHSMGVYRPGAYPWQVEASLNLQWSERLVNRTVLHSWWMVSVGAAHGVVSKLITTYSKKEREREREREGTKCWGWTCEPAFLQLFWPSHSRPSTWWVEHCPTAGGRWGICEPSIATWPMQLHVLAVAPGWFLCLNLCGHHEIGDLKHPAVAFFLLALGNQTLSSC